jgi:cell division protein FtsI/penicillin-binding protein 2
VLHTSVVPPFRLTGLRRWLLLSAVVASYANCQPKQRADWQWAVRRAALTAPDARILIVDIGSNKLVASYHLAEAARTLAAPGSTLKPLVLYQLIAASRWNPDRRIACDRNLAIAGHRLACSHPPSAPFNAREALAWSCNTYFSQVARSLQPGDLGRLLGATGLLGANSLAAKNGVTEATAEYREPGNSDSIQLALLGVEGIRITPFELATAYRWLALQIAAHPRSIAAEQVHAGMEDSADFGMASAASSGGMSVAGKTGTAAGATTSQTHGWFAGLAPANDPRVVVIIYLPSGHGADAARVAANLLAHARGIRP